MSRAFVCVLLLSAVVSGQGSPTFEVASIRPASEQTNAVRAVSRIAVDQVRFVSMSIKDYIGIAFGAKPQQIIGPDWLGQERFDLAATIPDGGSPAQIPLMMQSLLADRFGMRMHRETREFPVYVLRLAKSGPKFKPSAVTTPAPERDEKPPTVNVAAAGNTSGVTAEMGAGPWLA